MALVPTNEHVVAFKEDVVVFRPHAKHVVPPVAR
jgi:hypothetical protein